MHWDGSVSVGSVLTLIAMLAAGLVGYAKFVHRHTQAIAEIMSADAASTAAINNLSAIVERLQTAVTVQNGRLAKVETAIAIAEGVEKRIAAWKEHQP